MPRRWVAVLLPDFIVFAVAMARAVRARRVRGPVAPTRNARASTRSTARRREGLAGAANSGRRRFSAAQPAQARPNGRVRQAESQLPKMVFVVTATRIADADQRVGHRSDRLSGRKSIQSQQIQPVDDALREIPACSDPELDRPAPSANVSIRGATSAETLILIDGVTVNDSARPVPST